MMVWTSKSSAYRNFRDQMKDLICKFMGNAFFYQLKKRMFSRTGAEDKVA